MSKKTQLSLCMIVKNEEESLPRCLKSIRSLVNEIIVVDTGSNDSTMSVARNFGAKLYQYDWDDNFSNARNYSLSHAAGDWILVLDADEVLVCDDAEQFKLLLDEKDTEAYLLRIVSLMGAPYGKETSEDLVVRLFRNRSEYRFSGAIHEQVYPSIINSNRAGQVKKSHLTIYHDGYLSETIEKKNKISRNLKVINRALVQTPKDPFLLYSLACEYFLSQRYNKAVEAFQQALLSINAGAGYLPDLVFKLGLCLYKLGKIPEMLHLVNSLDEKSLLSSELLFLSGLIHLEKGDLKEAEQKISACLAKLPVSPAQHLNILDYQIYQALGEIHEAKQSWDEAARFYLQALKTKPEYLYPLRKIINLYKRHKPNLPIEETLGFCTPEKKCDLLKKINWQTEENIVIYLILGLARDITLSDPYVVQLHRTAITSLLNEKVLENTGPFATAAACLAKAIISLSGMECPKAGNIDRICSVLSENIRDILLMSS